MLLGAGAGTIVPVRVGARVVAILVAEANVAAVVVVAAAPRETLNHRAERPSPIHGTFPMMQSGLSPEHHSPFGCFSLFTH